MKYFKTFKLYHIVKENNLKHYTKNSLTTNSIYHVFYDDKGRKVIIRLSDHEPSGFREQADINLPLDTPFSEIKKIAENIIEYKEEKKYVFKGDEVAGDIIDHKVKSGFGEYVVFKDGSRTPLDSFENDYNVKIKWNTREEERNKKRGRYLLDQIKNKGYYIHYISYLKSKDRYGGHNNYSDAQEYFKQKEPEYKYCKPFTLNLDKKGYKCLFLSKIQKDSIIVKKYDITKKDSFINEYFNYLIENGFLSEPPENILKLPEPYKEPPDQKRIRNLKEELTQVKKSINFLTDGLLNQYTWDEFIQHFGDKEKFKDNMEKIKKLIKKQAELKSKIKDLTRK